MVYMQSLLTGALDWVAFTCTHVELVFHCTPSNKLETLTKNDKDFCVSATMMEIRISLSPLAMLSQQAVRGWDNQVSLSLVLMMSLFSLCLLPPSPAGCESPWPWILLVGSSTHPSPSLTGVFELAAFGAQCQIVVCTHPVTWIFQWHPILLQSTTLTSQIVLQHLPDGIFLSNLLTSLSRVTRQWQSLYIQNTAQHHFFQIYSVDINFLSFLKILALAGRNVQIVSTTLVICSLW